jgi:hypothetical protein
MTMTATVMTDEIESPEPLKPADRCDRSRAEQAFVRLQNDKGHILDLCGHHSNRYEADLIGAGFVIIEDIRDSINSKPSPSATVIGESPETEFEDDDDEY